MNGHLGLARQKSDHVWIARKKTFWKMLGQQENRLFRVIRLLEVFLLGRKKIKACYKVSDYRNAPKFLDRQVWANSADPDQTALGAV